MKLEGLRVVDLSLFLPGPFLTLVMADHGAEVIKIEPPGAGEPSRSIGLAERGHTTFFRNTHRGKQSVVLNLKHDGGREALLRLCETADVFVEGFRPGVVARLGVDYPAVAARNPRIVYCSISAFGQDGPYRDAPAHDLSLQALSGVVSVNLGPDDEPALPAVPAADLAAGQMALAAVLMALYRREQTGQGDYIDMAMHDALLSWMPNSLGPAFVDKRAPVPKHERTWGGGAFYRIYATSDGRHVVLAGQEPKFVRNLLSELGREDLIPLCEKGPGPHQAPVVEFLTGFFQQRTQAEWIDWFAGKDICFAPVKDMREAFDDPQAIAREMHLVDEHQVEHVGTPIRFRDEPGHIDYRVPQLGEHTIGVLSGLGYTDAELDSLRADGAIGR